MINGMLIDSQDNVGIAIYSIAKESLISYCFENKNSISLTAMENIPIYHKFAVRFIPKNDLIIKYGQPIGRAAVDILPGQHVHIHNVNHV